MALRKNNKSARHRIAAAVLLSLVLVLISVIPAFAAYPAHSEQIYDGPDALSESTERQIRKVNTESKSGATISVCVVPGTDGMSIDQYAKGLFTAWKLGEGVLIVVDTSTPDYYMIQSSGIADKITTADLEAVRDNYLEPDFNTGNIDSAVSKAVTKLSIDMSSKLAPAAEEQTETKSGPTFGSVIATIFKVILILVIIAIVIFAILFVIALFNDDVAALLRKYVFDRFKKRNRTSASAPRFDYDERLYGNRSQTQQNRQQANRYPQNGSQSSRQGDYRRYPQQNRNDGRNSGNSGYGQY